LCFVQNNDSLYALSIPLFKVLAESKIFNPVRELIETAIVACKVRVVITEVLFALSKYEQPAIFLSY
jgi:hypothetical protein